ncbi:unnamed protein product [Phytophthora fragariaefolia]|uniref:Unnamed protein product n=1 Tax=Phytophthora fragariaefolia TaxID=1490495 RepID=A0A9W6U967_9STRA|nr:unnamed protein product [Phytophthora fragariaefolia]
MPKTNSKSKKAPRATEATPPEAVAAAEESSPKEAMTPRVNGATSVKSGPHATSRGARRGIFIPGNQIGIGGVRIGLTGGRLHVRAWQAHLLALVRSGPSRRLGAWRRRGGRSMRLCRLPPRATEPSDGEPAPANTTASEPTPVVEAAVPSPDGASDARQAEDFLNSSDSQDPKSSASTTSPAKALQEPSSPPADGPDLVDYVESEPD